MTHTSNRPRICSERFECTQNRFSTPGRHADSAQDTLKILRINSQCMDFAQNQHRRRLITKKRSESVRNTLHILRTRWRHSESNQNARITPRTATENCSSLRIGSKQFGHVQRRLAITQNRFNKIWTLRIGAKHLDTLRIGSECVDFTQNQLTILSIPSDRVSSKPTQNRFETL
jgi:Holliday junction resolvasome RuvABC ATP-dependent DNA helicase subunit